MSVSLRISYKDPARPETRHPFSFERVKLECWWPLGDKLGLELIRWIDYVYSGTDRSIVEQLRDELEVVRVYLSDPSQTDVKPDDAKYMLERIGQIVQLLNGALAEWENVADVAL